MDSIINKSAPAVSISAIKAMNEDGLGSLGHSSTSSRSKNRVDPYSQTQNIDLIDHLTSGNTNSAVNGDLISTQRVLLHSSTETSLAPNAGSNTVKTTPMKTTAKRGLPKSRRIPKTKEDLTIASMMGRVKQQVGDLDRVRTSQMFTQPYQSVSKQEARITSIGEKKASAHAQSTYTPTAVNQSTGYNKPPAVMSLIEAKGPPNVTLPLSHSNMLPKAVAKGLEFPVSSSLQNTSHVQDTSTAQFESQPLSVRQDSHLFSPKVSTNVYWGRDEQVASNEGPQPPGLKQASTSNIKDGIPSETVIGEKLRGFEVAKGAHSNSSPLVATANSSKSEYSGQYLGHHFMKETNVARIAGNETPMPAQVNNISSNPKDTSQFLFKNVNLSKQNLLTESASKSTYPDKSTSNDFLGNGRSVPHVGASRLDEVVVGEPDVKVRATNTLSTVATTLKGYPQPVATSASPAIKSPKGVSGNVKESLSSKPFQAQSATSVSQPQQPDVPFQNLYGMPNPANVVKGAVSACKGNNAGANQPRFLIMGSQASQALQHLALQQSNTLQVSLQRTENSPAMYLQTLASYNPTTLNPPHGNIGFAYANVPIQLMALGGPQVVGKQQQAQTFNVDRYSNFYRYYSGSRQFEGTSSDHGNAVQATSLMFPGVNSVNQATGSYIRIAPASHTTNKIPLPMPVATTQSQAGQSALEEAQQQQHALSSSGTQPGLNLASSTTVSNTNVSSSTNSKETGHIYSAELARRPTIPEETLHNKGKHDDSAPPQNAATTNCSASLQSENILRMKTMQEAKSHNMAIQQTKVSSLHHIPQQSNGAGTLTAGVDIREVPKTSDIVVKIEPGLNNEPKVPIALQSPTERIDTQLSHYSRGKHLIFNVRVWLDYSMEVLLHFRFAFVIGFWLSVCFFYKRNAFVRNFYQRNFL